MYKCGMMEILIGFLMSYNQMSCFYGIGFYFLTIKRIFMNTSSQLLSSQLSSLSSKSLQPLSLLASVLMLSLSSVSAMAQSAMIQSSSTTQPMQPIQDATASVAEQTSRKNNNNSSKQPFYKGVQIGVSAYHVDAGFAKYEPETKIVPTVFYESQRMYVRGNQLGVNLIKSQDKELSAYVQTAGDPYNPKNAENEHQKLKKTNGSIMAGGSYLYVTRFGGLQAQMATEVAGNSGGSLAKLSYLAKFKQGGLTVVPSAGVTWYDKNYNNHYYGISQAESDATGLNSYQPNAGFSPFVSVMATYAMDDSLSLFFNQNTSLHGNEQLNSPKVKDRTISATTVGLLYTF